MGISYLMTTDIARTPSWKHQPLTLFQGGDGVHLAIPLPKPYGKAARVF